MKILLCFVAIFGTTLAGIPKGDALCKVAESIGLANHTACLPRSQEGLTAKQEQKMLDLHNELRAGVNPPAANMQKMVWDESLADLAQRWAETCKSGHDENKNREVIGHFDAGQNARTAPGERIWAKGAVKAWYNEVTKFNYSYEFNNGTGEIGHYTQVVWAMSSRLGCGAALCYEGGSTKHSVVCNYGPRGNWGGEKPYLSSETRGSACSDNLTEDYLCACEGKYCFSNGNLDVNGCYCSCKAGPATQDPYKDCKLTCPNPEDEMGSKYCNKKLATNKCYKSSINSVYCAKTCNTCEMLADAYV